MGAESALLRIDDALTLAHQIEQRGPLALTHRLRGDILLKRDLVDPSPAEEAYRTAIAIAKRQGARSYALLASLALAKLYQSTARPAKPTPSSRRRWKASHRRRKCRRSPKRKRC